MSQKIADGPWWVREKLPDKKRKRRLPIRCSLCGHLVAPSHMHRHHKSTRCRTAIRRLDVANRGLVRLWVCAPRGVYEDGSVPLERIGNTWYAPPWAHAIVEAYRKRGELHLAAAALREVQDGTRPHIENPRRTRRESRDGARTTGAQDRSPRVHSDRA